MRRLALPIALLCVLLPFTARAHPITPPVPLSDYPKHSEVVAGTISALWKFCNWDANCDVQIYLLHTAYPKCIAEVPTSWSTQTPDNPATCQGRLRGWMEVADTVRPSDHLVINGWIVFGSTYDNPIDAEGTAQDFVDTAERVPDFKLSKSQPNMLPGSDLGGSTILVYKSGIPDGVNAYLAVAFDGTAEVEASATWISGTNGQGAALKCLITETEVALAYQLANP